MVIFGPSDVRKSSVSVNLTFRFHISYFILGSNKVGARTILPILLVNSTMFSLSILPPLLSFESATLSGIRAKNAASKCFLLQFPHTGDFTTFRMNSMHSSTFRPSNFVSLYIGVLALLSQTAFPHVEVCSEKRKITLSNTCEMRAVIERQYGFYALFFEIWKVT